METAQTSRDHRAKSLLNVRIHRAYLLEIRERLQIKPLNETTLLIDAIDVLLDATETGASK